MPKKRTTRVYWRARGGQRRAYVDLRDLGGGREALVLSGESTATTDPDIAAELAAQRIREFEAQRRRKAITGIAKAAGLNAYAAHHISEKSKAGQITHAWLEQAEWMLTVATQFFGSERELASISVADVQAYAGALRTRDNGRGGTLSGGSQRHYLNALSNLYRRAQAEGYVLPGYNPVSSLLEKPTAVRKEAEWLEAHDAALLLESARTHVPNAERGALPFIYPLLATFLLTGGRKAEVLGLEVDDVSFGRRTVTFRPNAFRRLKTSTSHRSVPLWPQLEEILREYLLWRATHLPVERLLFPSPGSGLERMVNDTRKALDRIGARAGWEPGEIRTKMFRHTYCAARLQTLDRGAPVSPYTVGKELGHGGTSMVERVYSHLGQVRHRSERVEFRVKQHHEVLRERLAGLTTCGAHRSV